MVLEVTLFPFVFIRDLFPRHVPYQGVASGINVGDTTVSQAATFVDRQWRALNQPSIAAL